MSLMLQRASLEISIRGRQRGMVLVTSLLLLLVVTIMAVSMYRSYGIQERIAGNMREKQRALHAAVAAQQYAEWWLTNGNNAAASPVSCNGVINANQGFGQICVPNLVSAFTDVPWKAGAVEVGVDYTPPNMNLNTTGVADYYVANPRFYITDLGTSATGSGEVFQINAVGYGATTSAVAVVQSTFTVASGVIDRGGL